MERRVAAERGVLRPPVSSPDRPIDRARPTWLAIFLGIWGIWVTLPFLAPVFMHFGWSLPGQAIYAFYSFQCHQLPQRSFFLFGQQFTYSLPQIQAAWQQTDNPLILRQFIGNSSMGWKVAWSDRMVSMYTSVLLFAPLWYLFRRRIRALPLWGLFLFLLPMAIDGGTHTLSDLAGGIAHGWRYTNPWLAVLTHNSLPTTFLVGDAWGSFNSLMRLLTGLLFGLGVVWYVFPQMEDLFNWRFPSSKGWVGTTPSSNERSIEEKHGPDA